MRPRLSKGEIVFVTKVLKTYASVMEDKQKEMERREWKVKQLRNKFVRTGDMALHEELVHERQQLTTDKQKDYPSQMVVANILSRRFEALPKGGRLHSDGTHSFLKE